MPLLLVLTRPAEAVADPPADSAVLHVPLLELAPAQASAELRAQLAAAATADVLVFVSRAAATFAFALEPALGTNRRGDWCAVGPATAQRVRELFGVEVAAPAIESANSEGLLAILGEVASRRCALFAAPDGRDLLATTLRARGAAVDVIEVYRRQPAQVGEAEQRRLQARRAQLVFSATSIAVLDALHILLQQLGWTVTGIRLVVSAMRIADAARERGFTRLAIARSAAVPDLLETLRSTLWDS